MWWVRGALSTATSSKNMPTLADFFVVSPRNPTSGFSKIFTENDWGFPALVHAFSIALVMLDASSTSDFIFKVSLSLRCLLGFLSLKALIAHNKRHYIKRD